MPKGTRLPRILVIDDSKMIHVTITKALSNYKVDIITAKDGRDGCRKAVAEKPDVIFLDINMPDVDGLRALDALKKVDATSTIPIVMMTSHSDGQTQERAFDGGVIKYLPKPATPDLIVGVLTTILDVEKKS